MSIKVEGVTKLYGEQKALDNVSFNIPQGEVVGFLGPNGAGKSTMMKIISCFIPQSSGEVSVCEHDVVDNSIAVRANVGYLPENNPLYLDMYVKEYLAFVGGLHKVRKIKESIARIIELTGLTVEQRKKIGALSKGYRQRVGLAQALIHDPKVLILDEPTSGLDPNQLEEIRTLIKEVGKKKTVMLSTHIMQEVEAVCDRAIIINNGKIVADSPVSELKKNTAGEQMVVVEFDGEPHQKGLIKIVGVSKAKRVSEKVWKLTADSGTDIRPAVFQFAVDNNLAVLTMNMDQQSLEDVFKQLTK